jgi:hypothetical protein
VPSDGPPAGLQQSAKTLIADNLILEQSILAIIFYIKRHHIPQIINM